MDKVYYYTYICEVLSTLLYCMLLAAVFHFLVLWTFCFVFMNLVTVGCVLNFVKM